MKNKLILLPVLLATLAVGFVLYKSPGYADDVAVTTGAQSENQNPDTGGNINDKSGQDQGSVPKDIYYTKTVESVIFSHQTHAVDMGFKCDTCHTKTFEMKAKNVESKADFNMKGLAEGKYCGMCHSSKNNVAFGSDTQCARCHLGVKGLEREQ
ncbi:MAG: c(7)-type cytochrome triheme domain-containing protein [Thermoleophilia bacterium]